MTHNSRNEERRDLSAAAQVRKYETILFQSLQSEIVASQMEMLAERTVAIIIAHQSGQLLQIAVRNRRSVISVSFEGCTVQKGDIELRIRIVLTRNASQFLTGESVNLVEVLLLRPVRIPVLPEELIAPGNERRGRIAGVVRGPEFPAPGFIGDIDQRLGIVALRAAFS